MLQSKYIIFEDHDGSPQFIIFPSIIDHNKMALQLRLSKEIGNLISAGFIIVVDNKMKCYGKSISLNISSRGEEDSEFINKFF